MNIKSRLGFTPIEWTGAPQLAVGNLLVLDQRQLPHDESYLILDSPDAVESAIKNLVVRGAPLIGIASAYGLCLVSDISDDNQFQRAAKALTNCRPTAANLRYAIDRISKKRSQLIASRITDSQLQSEMLAEARAIHDEDAAMCELIGNHGNKLISQKYKILTHCNTGALATGGIGTALGIIYTAFWSGKDIHVWVDETRPVLQGARLTAWELAKANVPYTLITDSMAASLMGRGEVDLVIVGADRIAANHDVANKIGTYNLGVLCKHHDIPFYVAAPSSTFDKSCPTGDSIIIEQRAQTEVTTISGTSIAPANASAYNPVFDITPCELITGIVTEEGVIRNVVQTN